MAEWLTDILMIALAGVLVGLNGFFVAAEFALVKVRGTQVDEMVASNRPFAKIADWLVRRLDGSLSACQLGITMASLGLGWIGEPALAHLMRPLFQVVGITSEIAIHTVAFIVAFTIITAAHLVLGEQAPKIFAIRRPQIVLLWCAVPMKIFYYLSFPFLVALNASTSFLLRRVGIDSASEHDAVRSEDEIRTMLRRAHVQGELTLSEHRLLHAVFEFDDMICRKIMVPRSDVAFIDLDEPFSKSLDLLQRTKHTRYPVCNGSLDAVVGVIHIKDLVGLSRADANLRSIMRPPHRVPETIPISQLLKYFQANNTHMALVIDEHGMTVGVVTLENVVEQIVGPIEDEFDNEQPDIVPDGKGQFLVLGSTAVDAVCQRLNLSLDTSVADTFSGFLVCKAGRLLKAGDRIELDAAIAEVIEIDGERASRVRVEMVSIDDFGDDS